MNQDLSEDQVNIIRKVEKLLALANAKKGNEAEAAAAAAKAQEMLAQANAIIETYEGQGYSLTLRQLYYQFVARDLLPNSQASYNKLGDLVSRGRMAGLVS